MAVYDHPFQSFQDINYSEVVYASLFLGTPWDFAGCPRLHRLALVMGGTGVNGTPHPWFHSQERNSIISLANRRCLLWLNKKALFGGGLLQPSHLEGTPSLTKKPCFPYGMPREIKPGAWAEAAPILSAALRSPHSGCHLNPLAFLCCRRVPLTKRQPTAQLHSPPRSLLQPPSPSARAEGLLQLIESCARCCRVRRETRLLSQVTLGAVMHCSDRFPH